MEGETSGFGAISTTSTRSSRLDLWVARARSSSQLVSVRCQHRDAAQVKTPIVEHRQQHRMSARRPCGGYP